MSRDARGVALAVGGCALGGSALGVAAWWLLRLGSVNARPAYLVGVGVTALALVLLCNVARVPADAIGSAADDQEAAGAGPRPVVDIISLEHRLAWGGVDAERFESRVRPLLVRVAAERLQIRHGVDHTREPDRARSIVGERLWELMTGPARPDGRAPSHRVLARIVAEIERI